MISSMFPQLLLSRHNNRRFARAFSIIRITQQSNSNGRIATSSFSSLTRTRVRAVVETKLDYSNINNNYNNETSDNNISNNITRTMVHRMRVKELRQELQRRGYNDNDFIDKNRSYLVTMLLNDLVKEKYINNNETTSSTTTTNIQYYDSEKRKEEEEDSIDINSKNKINPNKTYILRIRGLANKQSDRTGIGMLLKDINTNTTVWMGRIHYPISRSLYEAEYTALILGLRYVVKRFQLHNIILQTHESVIYNHIQGLYPVEKVSLKPLYKSVTDLIDEINDDDNSGSFQIQLISKLDNIDCEELAAKALATGISIFDSELDDNLLFTSDPMMIQNNNESSVHNQTIFDQKDEYFDESDISSHQSDDEIQSCSSSNEANNNNVNDVHNNIDPDKVYLLQFDGGSRGNPGIAGAGMVIYDTDSMDEIWCGWKYLHIMSNNQAEYNALLLGLKCAYSLGIRNIHIQGDSELIVKQINGIYKVKNNKLNELYKLTKLTMNEFDECTISHIFRNENKRADWLANNAMNNQSSHGFDEIPNY